LSTLAASTDRMFLCESPWSMVPSASISVTCSLDAWSAIGIAAVGIPHDHFLNSKCSVSQPERHDLTS
jgi:hypothetical protein